MTIPEAVMLVLQAGLYANGGEIFILDMGSPVKIYDLAVSLIKLKGLKPNEDIKIKIVGLRPGEKLYEELNTMGIDTILDELNNLREKYYVITKIHHGTAFLKDEVERIGIQKTKQIASHKYRKTCLPFLPVHTLHGCFLLLP